MAQVPTAIVAKVLQKHMAATSGPVLLDGFPRTADQIDIVATVGLVKHVLFLDAPEEVLLQRLSKEDCGDTVALLAQFTDHCLPVISMYDDAGLVQRIDTSVSMEDVYFAMVDVLSAVLPPPPVPWVPEYKATTVVPDHAVVGGAETTNSYTRVSLPLITRTDIPMTRKTKIVCTLGPACWEEDQLAELLHAGCNVARFNFSHGDHAGHQKVLDRFRKVCAEKGSTAAVLLDTKGPEIRTAMLRDGKDIQLDAGQELVLHAAGDDYTTFEGFKDEATGETVIGCSYAALAQSVKPGNRILWADGSVVFVVKEILDEKNVLCTCLNSKKLGQRKNGNLPGVKVDLPVLMEKDIDDLQNFACKNQMDYVAISFVQSGEDVQFVRRVLDEAGGENIKIISKIENEAGLVNFDDILKYTDGVMVARGDLGMEIPSEKVPLAQKWMITRCNIAGKFVVTATQMLESMCGNPLPTRAEMTDVANSVLDGTDCTMLSGETANGIDPANACATMARIAANAELACSYQAVSSFTRDFTAKPFSASEAVGMAVTYAALDAAAALVVALVDDPAIVLAIAKYRPCVPVVVVTTSPQLARATNSLFGIFPCLVADSSAVQVSAALGTARKLGLFRAAEGAVILLGKDLSLVVRNSGKASVATTAFRPNFG